ncbi:ABC transporter substrate-binding protein [Rhodosalinus sp. FB01]|uniref:ABC transporter substrate-binding protein n=1 Tax=Rhodosalinus sp. FB01 TaxID=3239194 RepID=UPI0035247942
MPHPTINGKPVHPAAIMYAEEFKAGKLSRREFLARASSLGVTAAGAYALGGLGRPAAAQATPQDGGTLRVQMAVRALKDPRTADWSQIANVYRGWLDYLVEYQADGTFRPMLLESWEINEDATEYQIKVREGVTWNNGDAFTAEDVAHNIRRWGDKEVEANSMAARVASLIDDETGQIREGAIEVTGTHTLTLRPSVPDITLIAGFADYPAAVVHPSYNGENPTDVPIGTGPFLPESHEVGIRSVLVRNEDHRWWGADVYGGPYLDRVEFIDFGTDPASWLAAAESEEVDMLYESVGEFIDILDAIGWTKSEAVTANTITIRPNQEAMVGDIKPYADARVRRALALAVDNAVCLELGYAGLGTVAENHHVCPIHPEYADIGPAPHDPEQARALMEEAGMADFEHELISIDDDWRKNTTDAVAAQLRDAGINVTRVVLPGSTFWNDWAQYPFSSTNWNMRPLGVQVLALAYRSGEAWNETAYANPDFDAKLAEAMSIADADQRRQVMAEVEQMLRDDGVIIQPYWRSIYRHYTDRVVGAEMHPTFEIHTYQLGLAA